MSSSSVVIKSRTELKQTKTYITLSKFGKHCTSYAITTAPTGQNYCKIKFVGYKLEPAFKRLKNVRNGKENKKKGLIEFRQ